MRRAIALGILVLMVAATCGCASGPEKTGEEEQGGWFSGLDFGNRDDQQEIRGTRDFD